MEAETIRCEQHGQRQATFVCQHLLTGSAKGWIAIESGDAGGPDAICAECDTAWRAAGDEFTDAIRSETKFASGWCAPGATYVVGAIGGATRSARIERETASARAAEHPPER